MQCFHDVLSIKYINFVCYILIYLFGLLFRVLLTGQIYCFSEEKSPDISHLLKLKDSVRLTEDEGNGFNQDDFLCNY